MKEGIFVNKKKRRIIILSVSVLLVLAIVAACVIYLSDYYHADDDRIEAFMPDGVDWSEDNDGNIVLKPGKADVGLIFYPGGKVEHTAYVPLLQACAGQGILCVIVEMPFNLAVFDINGADGIREQYPEIDRWYIGGHSLGGSMAAAYLEDNAKDFDGLILLGSYSTADLSETELDILSVYGSEDRVLNKEKYDENRDNLPDDFYEIVIDGGCHAYFGMYGEQDGDGIATVTNEEQIAVTAAAISDLVRKK